MKTIKKSLALFFFYYLISTIPISAAAEENLNTHTSLYDSLSSSGELNCPKIRPIIKKILHKITKYSPLYY